MSYESNKGVSKVAVVVSERMRDMTGKIPTAVDTGVIQDDYSLKLNSYEKPLPRGEYSVCRQLTLGETNTHLTFTIPAGNPEDGTHSHGSSGTHSHGNSSGGAHYHTNEGAHVHDVLIPEKMRGLRPGDRVLAAWVQNEAVVIDIIVKS